MVLADPGQELEPRVLVLVQDQVEQHRRHARVLEHVLGLQDRGGDRRPVTEVLKVDPKLLQHRGLVFHDEDRRPEHVGRAVDLEPGRQRWQTDLAPGAVGRSPTDTSVFQDHPYIIINED